MSARILTVDIETKPAQAYVWGLFDQNVSLSQLIAPSAPICVAAKFLGEKEVYFFSDWGDGHDDMIRGIHALIMEADAVVTYNGDRFDLPKLRGEFLLLGLPPIPQVTSIDLYKVVRKLGFQSGKLEYIGPLLDIGGKIKHEGFSLWTKVMAGNGPAQARMEKYCKGDVRLTERGYLKLRPYITNHPYLSDIASHNCGACGSGFLQKRGFRRTKAFLIQRMQCQDCGSWSDGTRRKV